MKKEARKNLKNKNLKKVNLFLIITIIAVVLAFIILYINYSSDNQELNGELGTEGIFSADDFSAEAITPEDISLNDITYVQEGNVKQFNVSYKIITDQHRYAPGAMFGGWGQHLGHLLNTGQELWFADDTGNDVNKNPAINYYLKEGDKWIKKGSNILPGTVQQNTASILSKNIIYSYGIDISGKYLVECNFNTTDYKGSCNNVINTPSSSNYIGAALSPLGYRIVWWTQVIPNSGIIHYLYNNGKKWSKVISSSLVKYSDASYATISFIDNSNFYMNAALVNGNSPNWNFVCGVSKITLGHKIGSWVILKNITSGSATQPNDIWADPRTKSVHTFTQSKSGSTKYFYKPKSKTWSRELYSFNNSYSARIIDSIDGNLYLAYGTSGESLNIIYVNKSQINGAINWKKLNKTNIKLPQGYENIYGIYPESKVYQDKPVKEINLAIVGSERQNEVLHVRIEVK